MNGVDGVEKKKKKEKTSTKRKAESVVDNVDDAAAVAEHDNADAVAAAPLEDGTETDFEATTAAKKTAKKSKRASTKSAAADADNIATSEPTAEVAQNGSAAEKKRKLPRGDGDGDSDGDGGGGGIDEPQTKKAKASLTSSAVSASVPVSSSVAAVSDVVNPPLTDFDIAPTTIKVLSAKGITHMFPIQAQTYNHVHAGTDVVGRARTGTGKCWGLGTELVLFSGQYKRVEMIRAGDVLMGDDNTPRTVLPHSVISGRATMYRITSDNDGDGQWTCNGDHILVLQCRPRSVPLQLNGQWRLRCITTCPGKDVGSFVLCESLLPQTFRDAAAAEQANAPESSPFVFECSVNDFMSLPDELQRRCMMYRPVLVNFPQFGLSLQQRMETICKRTVTADDVTETAWMLGLRLTQRNEANKKEWNGDILVRCKQWRSLHDDDMIVSLLKSYGVADDLRIPHSLLTDTRDVRRALLAGVVDGSGGDVSQCGSVQLQSAQRSLMDGLSHLSRALGLAVGTIDTHMNALDDLLFPTFRINITGDVLADLPTSTPLNIGKTSSEGGEERGVHFTIAALSADDYYGFTLDGNGRCLLANFHVTHNTLAFALPICERLQATDRQRDRLKVGRGPRVIVLVPTRELAKQVAETFERKKHNTH